MRYILYPFVIVFGVIWTVWKLYQIDKAYEPKLRKIKGNSGESVVTGILNDLDTIYKVRHDIRIGRTQIDHMVSKGKLLFVIETKRWSGKIVGKRSDDKWKQVLHGEEHWYKNPVKQNEYHITKLKKSGQYNEYKMVNVVVFINNDKVPKLKNVISQDELYNFIMEYGE